MPRWRPPTRSSPKYWRRARSAGSRSATPPPRLRRRAPTRCATPINPITARRFWHARKAPRSPRGLLPNAWFTFGPIILPCRPTRAWCTGIAGTLENEAIRPHVAGRFVDLLTAVEQHPAMIAFLDNQYFGGQGSGRAASRRNSPPGASAPKRQFGINENLAREILELHTLGVNGGYTQADVTSFAQIITGMVDRRRQGPSGRRRFPGASISATTCTSRAPRSFSTKPTARRAVARARPCSRIWRSSPATAHFIATKLVRHFIADDPPPAAVNRVAKAFLKTGGDLPQVYAALVQCSGGLGSRRAQVQDPGGFRFLDLAGA